MNTIRAITLACLAVAAYTVEQKPPVPPAVVAESVPPARVAAVLAYMEASGEQHVYEQQIAIARDMLRTIPAGLQNEMPDLVAKLDLAISTRLSWGMIKTPIASAMASTMTDEDVAFITAFVHRDDAKRFVSITRKSSQATAPFLQQTQRELALEIKNIVADSVRELKQRKALQREPHVRPAQPGQQ